MMFNLGTDRGPSKAGSERLQRYREAATKAGFTSYRDVQKWMRETLDQAADLTDKAENLTDKPPFTGKPAIGT